MLKIIHKYFLFQDYHGLIFISFPGRHESISLNMMVAGHTKFAPDWHFGVFKVKWRDSDAETMDDIARVVTSSSRNGHNIPQLVNDHQKPVVFYEWRNFLSPYFKTLPGLSEFHHFTCSASEPGVVYCKKFANSEPVLKPLLKIQPPEDTLPAVKTTPGLDAARQWYLYEQIAQFFKCNESRNKVCPKPVVPKVELKLKEDHENSCKKGRKRKSSLLN